MTAGTPSQSTTSPVAADPFDIRTIAAAAGFSVPPDVDTFAIKCFRTENHKNGDLNPSLRLDLDLEKNLWYCPICDKGGGPDQLREGLGLPPVTAAEDPEARSWLTTKRGITAENILANIEARLKFNDKWIGFRYTDATGQLRCIKWRKLAEKKFSTTPKGAEPCLFNLPGITSLADDTTMCIVEGEIDALSLMQLGLVVVSVPNGTGSKLTTALLAPIMRFQRFVLLTDADKDGEKLARKLAKQLGVGRCLRARLGEHKDSNDALQAGWSREQFEDAIGAAQPLADSPPRGVNAADTQSADSGWRAQFTGTRDGRPAGTASNVDLVVRHDEAWVDVLGYDDRAEQPVVLRAPPWPDEPARQSYPRPLTDDDVLRAIIQMERAYGLRTTLDTAHRTLLAASRRASFDPVRQWLDGLVWDGAPRLDGWLSRFVGAEDAPYTKTVGSKWLISAIARTFSPGCIADYMLVLYGPQGIRKSTVFRTLVGDERFTDSLPSVESKDAAIQLLGMLVVELSELDALNRSEMSAVKAFISRRVDRYRPPYGRQARDFPRRCILGGSTNEVLFQRDHTGGRRFWPVECRGEIDIAGLREVREQLWAEAVVRYRGGERWYLDEEPRERDAEQEQERCYQGDAWADTVARWLEETSTKSTTTGEILEKALNIPCGRWSRGDQMRVGAIMSRLRWPRRQVTIGSRREWRYQRPDPPHPTSPAGAGPSPRSGAPDGGPGPGPATDTPPASPAPPQAPGGDGTEPAGHSSDSPPASPAPPDIQDAGNTSGTTAPVPSRILEDGPSGAAGAGGAVDSIVSACITNSDTPPLLTMSAPLQVVRSADELPAVAAAVERAGVVGLDLETTGLDPLRDRPRLAQVALPDGTVRVVDLFATGGLGPLADALRGVETVVIHNAAFEASFLRRHFGVEPRAVWDCMLAAQVLDGGLPRPDGYFGLKEVVHQHLGFELNKTQQTSDWSGALTDKQVTYAARDVQVLLPLRKKLTAALDAEGLLPTVAIENAALPAVVDIRLNGFLVDKARWEALVAETATEAAALAAEMRSQLGVKNPDSAPQVTAALVAAGVPLPRNRKGNYSANKEALAGLAARFPVADIVRRCNAAKGFPRGFGKHVLDQLTSPGADGRVRCDVRQILDTGRMSCSKPALQGVPKRDTRVRPCFVADPGYVLVRADYGQIELRVLAEITQDRTLIEQLQPGGDPHRMMAASILGVPSDAVTPEQRQRGKAPNFGFAFGMSPDGFIAYASAIFGVAFSRREAEAAQAAYFQMYAGVRRWQLRTEDTPPTITRTLGGRIRRFPEPWYAAQLNAPVQGTAADGMKVALALLHDRLPALGARLLLAVHDEVVVEAPVENAEVVRAAVVVAMKEGMGRFVKVVPIEVEADVRSTWAQEEK